MVLQVGYLILFGYFLASDVITLAPRFTGQFLFRQAGREKALRPFTGCLLRPTKRISRSRAVQSRLRYPDTSLFLVEGRNLSKKVPSETAICSGMANAITTR